MEPIGRLLVVEDNPAVVQAIRLALRPVAPRIDAIAGPGDILEMLERGRYAAVLLDMNFRAGEHDGRAGLDAIDLIRKADPNLAVVVLTVHGGLALAIEALKRGACDFLLKPWRNDRLIEALAAAAALTAEQRAGAAMSLEQIERRAIQRSLERHDGNISKAAAELGLTRPALYRRIGKHGI